MTTLLSKPTNVNAQLTVLQHVHVDKQKHRKCNKYKNWFLSMIGGITDVVKHLMLIKWRY